MSKIFLILATLALFLTGCSRRTFQVEVTYQDHTVTNVVCVGDDHKISPCADLVQTTANGQMTRLVVQAEYNGRYEVQATVEEPFGKPQAKLVSTFDQGTPLPLTMRSDSQQLSIAIKEISKESKVGPEK